MNSKSTKRPKRPTAAQTEAAKVPAKKKARKKRASKAKRNKNAPQTARAVVPRDPAVEMVQKITILRLMAATDFLADPDKHSVRWHYERPDRPYEKTVLWKTFESWSVNDKWIKRRHGHWEDIESRVRANFSDESVRVRIDERDRLERTLDDLAKYLEPLVNQETGALLIDEVTGLPRFALEMPSMDKFVTMYLKLHERIMLLRGEVTERTEQLSTENNPNTADAQGLNEHLKQPAAIPPNFSKRDLRAMATKVLMNREPSLGGTLDSDIIDAPMEDENGNADQHDDTA